MSKIAILLENEKYVGTVNMDTGATVGADNQPAPTVPAAQVPMMTALFMHAKGEEIPVTHGWWDQPATGQPDVREQYGPGEHDIIADASRKVVELNGVGAFLFRIKAAKDGRLRLQLAGKPSGALNGAVGIAMPGEAGNQVADGNLDSFDRTIGPVKAGDVVTLSLRKDGGDDKTEFPIWSL